MATQAIILSKNNVGFVLFLGFLGHKKNLERDPLRHFNGHQGKATCLVFLSYQDMLDRG